jgi:hypothetical protein
MTEIMPAKTNQLLFGMCQKMRVELECLKNEPQTALTWDFIKAASLLGLPSYRRFKRFAERALWDLVIKSEIDPISQLQCYLVQSMIYPGAPPQVFLSKDQRCTCKKVVKELNQCANEILLTGGFDPLYFLERHFSQDCVKGSLSGWNASNDNYIRDLLGFEDKVLITMAIIID